MGEKTQAVRLCRNGHIKKLDISRPLAHRLGLSTEIHLGNDYCGECGEEIIWKCDNCDSHILVQNDFDPEFQTLPEYCKNCGTSYPWTDPIEDNKERDEKFLNLSDSEINGQFYPSTVYEINLCYKVKADHATVILLRKLVENLLLDIIRGHFGMDNVEIFYRLEERQHKSLADLIEVFDENQGDFDRYTTAKENEIVSFVEQIKYSGDAAAHSIEEKIDEEELESLSEEATHFVKVLFRLRQEVQTAHKS